jgi:hypothetical protein
MESTDQKKSASSDNNNLNTSGLANAKLTLEVLKLRLESIGLILGLAFIASFSFGALLLFLYFSRNHFNSGGISAGDTVSFALLTFGFIGLLVIILLYTTLAGYPIARLFYLLLKTIRKTKKFRRLLNVQNLKDQPFKEDDIGLPVRFEWKPGYRLILILGAATLAIYIFLIYEAPPEGRAFLFAMLVAGVWLSLFAFGKSVPIYSPWPRRVDASVVDSWINRLSQPMRQFVVSLFVIFAIVALVIGVMQDASMVAAGFRKHNVAVRVSKEDLSNFIERATRFGLVVNPCEQITPSTNVINRVDVIWHKLGTVGLLRFPTQPLFISDTERKSIKQFRMEVNNSALAVLDEEVTLGRCEEFLSDGLFDPSNRELTVQGKMELERHLPWIANIAKDRKVRISAHNLQKPVPGKALQTTETWAQAVSVKKFLEQKFGLDSSQIEIIGLEGVENKQPCEQVSVQIRQKCEKTNRRFEVRVYNPSSGT